MSEHFLTKRSGATIALLLFLLLSVPACGASTQGTGSEQGSDAPETTGVSTTTSETEKTRAEKAPEKKAGKPEDSKKKPGEKSGKTVEAVLPEDVLSEDEIAKPPEPKDWNAQSGATVSTTSRGTSAGTIPAVEPFNFGRDPGGPEDKALYMDIPKLGMDYEGS